MRGKGKGGGAFSDVEFFFFYNSDLSFLFEFDENFKFLICVCESRQKMKTHSRRGGDSSGVEQLPNTCEVLSSTHSTEITKGHIAEIPTLNADPTVATKPSAAVHTPYQQSRGFNFSSCQETEPLELLLGMATVQGMGHFPVRPPDNLSAQAPGWVQHSPK